MWPEVFHEPPLPESPLGEDLPHLVYPPGDVKEPAPTSALWVEVGVWSSVTLEKLYRAGRIGFPAPEPPRGESKD
jgi:hypothetical protein